MILIKSATALAKHLQKVAAGGKTIGFVPTMGALHAGHLSLLETAKNANDYIVFSIFINPTQFNDPRDFEKYPVTLDKDIELLESIGTDLLFLPSVAEIYPKGTSQLQHYAIGFLETVLEGKYRPGHFQGVCQVMHRLLELVHPHDLYMGQKDFQQCMVVKKLLQLTGIATNFHTCATLREADGLAMSSRNMRLSQEERQKAVAISAVLELVCQSVRPGQLEQIAASAEQTLSDKGFKVDYVAIAAADTLEMLEDWDGQRPLVTLAAAYLNEVRLIDNKLIPAYTHK